MPTVEQKRLVEEYPQFEAEFGLPAGLDLSQPAHVVFPPPEQVWQVRSGSAHGSPGRIASGGPKKRSSWRSCTSAGSRWACKLSTSRPTSSRTASPTQAYAEFRKRQDAVWQAEADRRNAAEEAKDQEYASMDEAHRRAYHLGVLRGLEAAQEQAEEEAQKKPAAKAAVGS